MIGLDELIPPTYGVLAPRRIPGLDFPVDSDGKRSTTGLNQGLRSRSRFLLKFLGAKDQL